MNIMYKEQKFYAPWLYRSSNKRVIKLKKNFRLELKGVPYSKAYIVPGFFFWKKIIFKKYSVRHTEVFRVQGHDACNLLSNDSAKMCVFVWESVSIYT